MCVPKNLPKKRTCMQHMHTRRHATRFERGDQGGWPTPLAFWCQNAGAVCFVAVYGTWVGHPIARACTVLRVAMKPHNLVWMQPTAAGCKFAYCTCLYCCCSTHVNGCVNCSRGYCSATSETQSSCCTGSAPSLKLSDSLLPLPSGGPLPAS